MKKRTRLLRGLIVPLALGVLLSPGCAARHGASRLADHSQARAEIERCLQAILVAAETKDFQRLDSYHLYGPGFTKFTGTSAERLDAAAGRKGEHDGLGSITGLKLRADQLKIDVFGQTGIATFILAYSFEAGGTTVHKQERSTLVFVQDRGDWKIVHEHLSPVAP